jgi:hypothetical protein
MLHKIRYQTCGYINITKVLCFEYDSGGKNVLNMRITVTNLEHVAHIN